MVEVAVSVSLREVVDESVKLLVVVDVPLVEDPVVDESVDVLVAVVVDD
jgi:hypothetical protein